MEKWERYDVKRQRNSEIFAVNKKNEPRKVNLDATRENFDWP